MTTLENGYVISYLFLLIAVVFFVWGIVSIAKGWQGSAAEIVPLAELDVIKDLHQGYPVGEMMDRVPSSTTEEVAPSVKSAQSAPPPEEEKVAELNAHIRMLEEQSAARETQDKERIAALTTENQTLKNQVEKHNAEIEQFTQKLAAQQEANAQSRSQEESKINELNTRLQTLQQEREQSSSQKNLVEELKNQNEQLQQQDREYAAKIDGLQKDLSDAQRQAQEQQGQFQQRFEQLKKENDDLLAQIQEKEGQVSKVKSSLELMQKTNNQRLNEATEAVRVLKAQKQESDRIQEELLNKQLAKAVAAVEELKKEKQNLVDAKAGLEQNLEKIRGFNAHLLEKERILQYELTKHRAQALGLEKICEDFKIQIDAMAKSSVANK